MSITKSKQKFSNLGFKTILGSYLIIVGEAGNNNKDMVVFISKGDVFERIALGEDFELNENYTHEIVSIQKINIYTKPRIEKIFRIIDSDPTISNEIPEINLNIIKEFIITKITLQQLEYNTFLNSKIRKIIQNEKPIIYIRLYIYLTSFDELLDLLNIKRESDLDRLFKVLLKAYEILKELNPDQPRTLNGIIHRINNILNSPEKIELKIDTNILGLIKIPIQLKELKEEKNRLESDLSIIDEKLETKLTTETEPGEFENDPEVKELKERKKGIEKRLKEIENEIKELREEWERLRSNRENN